MWPETAKAAQVGGVVGSTASPFVPRKNFHIQQAENGWILETFNDSIPAMTKWVCPSDGDLLGTIALLLGVETFTFNKNK